MGCSKCTDYSYSLGRCKRGMILPRTIKGALEAATFMGWGYICGKSPLKGKAMNKAAKELAAKLRKGDPE